MDCFFKRASERESARALCASAKPRTAIINEKVAARLKFSTPLISPSARVRRCCQPNSLSREQLTGESSLPQSTIRSLHAAIDDVNKSASSSAMPRIYLQNTQLYVIDFGERVTQERAGRSIILTTDQQKQVFIQTNTIESACACRAPPDVSAPTSTRAQGRTERGPPLVVVEQKCF